MKTNLDDLIRRALEAFWEARADGLECVAAEDERRCYRVVSDGRVLSVKVHPLGEFFDDIVQGLRVQRDAAERGIRTNPALPSARGELSEEIDGYGVVVQPWIEGEPFSSHPERMRALGEAVGSLHALTVPGHLEPLSARLEPRRTLDAIRDEVLRRKGGAPARHRPSLERFWQRAGQLDALPSVPRAIIHTDLAWSNAIGIDDGRIALIDFEGAGIGPPVVDLVEVTTYLTLGPSGSGPLVTEWTQAFYEGYRRRRLLLAEELAAFPKAHFFHQLFHLANALERGDYGFIERMEARLESWDGGVLAQLVAIAAGEA